MRRWPRSSSGRRSRSRRDAAPSSTGRASRSRSASTRRPCTPTRGTSSPRSRRRQGGGDARHRPGRRLPRALRPHEAVRLPRAQGRPGEGQAPPAARDPGDRLLPRGAADLSAGARRIPAARLRGDGQPGPRRARALARQEARRQGRVRDRRPRPGRVRRSTSSRRARSGRERTSYSPSTTSCRRPPSSCSPRRFGAGTRRARLRS